MKILFLSDNYPPEMTANARIVKELAAEWCKNGHTVSVLTSFPNYPKGKIFTGYKNKIYQKEQDGLTSVHRVKTFMHPNKGVFFRILDFLSYMISSFIAGLFQKKIDIIVAITPQFFCAVSGCMLSIIRRKPFVLFLCDLWPDSVVSVGAMKMSLGLRFMKYVEKWMYKRASIIFTLSPSFNTYLQKSGIQEDKIHLSISGYDATLFFPRNPNIELLEHYKINDKFIIGYMGTMGMAHDIALVLEMAKTLSNSKKIQFILIGDGIDRAKIQQQVARDHNNNVIVDGPFPGPDMPKYWSIFDISLVILKDIETNTTVIPSKMLESMAMGRPIILYAPKGQASMLITESKSGIFVESGNTDRLIEKLSELADNGDSLDEYSRNGILYAKGYTRERQASLALEQMMKLGNK